MDIKVFARFRDICFDSVPDFNFNSRAHTCSRFLNMAARPKRVAKKPARFSDLFCENKSDKPEQKRYKPNNDKTLYNIEVTEVDKENKRLKIHYVGYCDSYDEWREYDGDEEYFPFIRQEKRNLPTKQSLEDRVEIFHQSLSIEIKKKLWSWRREDPEVAIDIDVDKDAFEAGLGKAGPSKQYRGKQIYTLRSNKSLNDVLGQKWDERIQNTSGDFAYVVEGTVRYWLGKRSPVIEYKYIGNKLIKNEIENSSFQFVRGDGNRYNYNERT